MTETTEREGSLSSRAVLGGLAVSLVLALGVAFYIYVRYVRFEATAGHHVPADAELVVRVDVQQAVVYQPFREHLLSLLEVGRREPEPRLLHLERKTSLELGVDTREVVYAFGPETWTIAVGGLFRRERAVTGVARMLEDEGIPHRLAADPQRVLVGPPEAERGVFGVTEDGTLLGAGTERSWLSAAPRAPTARAQAAPGELLVVEFVPAGGLPLSSGGRLHELRGAVRAGKDFSFRFEARLEGDRIPWRELGDQGLELGALERSSPRRVSPDRLRWEGELSRSEFEQILARLAARVRSAARLPI